MPASAVDEITHREQMRRVDEVHAVVRYGVLHRSPLYWLTAFAFQKYAIVGLVLGADAAVERAVGLDLVQVLGVFAGS